MATYVMGDPHGQYDAFCELLEQVGFGEGDRLYVLGDMIDRGSGNIEILSYCRLKRNVFVLRGNHEQMALDAWAELEAYWGEESPLGDDPWQNRKELDKLLYAMRGSARLHRVSLWAQNGGNVTLEQLFMLSAGERERLLKYMDTLPYYYEVSLGERTYLLTHATLWSNTHPASLTSPAQRHRLLWNRDIEFVPYFGENTYLISGHTPVQYVAHTRQIYRNNHHILMDTGAAVKGGYLSLLCLEDQSEIQKEISRH